MHILSIIRPVCTHVEYLIGKEVVGMSLKILIEHTDKYGTFQKRIKHAMINSCWAEECTASKK